MSKPAKVRTKTPRKFANEAEERAYWESHDSTSHLDWSKAQKVTLPNLKPTTKTARRRSMPSAAFPGEDAGHA